MKTLIQTKNLLNNISFKKIQIIALALSLLMSFTGVNVVKADTQNFSNTTVNATGTILSGINSKINDATSSNSFLVDTNEIKAPEIVAKNAVVYDILNKRFVYAKNANEQVGMASLVKIITSAVFLQLNSARKDQGNIIEKIQITKSEKGFNEGDRGLINGEIWKVENLIRYMLITSSNVAAQSLTRSIIDDEFAFALLMNKTVKDLGYKSFNFKNVSGLSITNPKSPFASSTPKEMPSAVGNAKEIAILFNSIFTAIPFLGNASIIPEATFLNWSGNTHTTKNVNYSLFQIPHIIAGKTGTTNESGGNLILITNPNNQRYAIVILGSTIEERYNDALKLASSTETFAMLK